MSSLKREIKVFPIYWKVCYNFVLFKLMLEVGDLVTVNSKELKMHLSKSVYDRWLKNTLGIVVDVSGYRDKGIVLVKVWFQSLGSSYWLYSHEVFPVRHEPPWD